MCIHTTNNLRKQSLLVQLNFEATISNSCQLYTCEALSPVRARGQRFTNFYLLIGQLCSIVVACSVNAEDNTLEQQCSLPLDMIFCISARHILMLPKPPMSQVNSLGSPLFSPFKVQGIPYHVTHNAAHVDLMLKTPLNMLRTILLCPLNSD